MEVFRGMLQALPWALLFWLIVAGVCWVVR